jgi:hypothetical protein
VPITTLRLAYVKTVLTLLVLPIRIDLPEINFYALCPPLSAPLSEREREESTEERERQEGQSTHEREDRGPKTTLCADLETKDPRQESRIYIFRPL